MVGQMSGGNERSRTYWTAAMERYFIDLMVEQMQRGARIGHTFNKQAWSEMLAMFNHNFGSQYDKEVLKSRYTTLWKQFHDVKTLLSHTGFSWDEPTQMVVAEDNLWDSYIKAHPDVRSYKTKAILNFSDLCLIYGYSVADGRYSRSSHDIDFDDEVQGVNTCGNETYGIDSSSNGHQRTDWTSDMDQYFIELMLDQVGRGNKIASTFSKEAWTDMLVLFNAKYGPQHSKRVLRHRHKKMSKYYGDVTVLLKHSGFSWNETQQMVVADDHVWDAYTKTHPHARSYRTKPLPNYYDLMLIFGNGINPRLNSFSNGEKNLEDDVVQVITGDVKGSQISCVGDRTRTFWTPPMDHYLVNLLLDQVHRGNKIGKTFISQAWIDMVTLFNSQFKSYHDKDVLKNRYKHLRRQYNDIRTLIEQSGFSWDEAREMIVAEDHVWDAYTKAHPDARTYRVKTVPSFHKLCAIFEEEQSDRRYSRLALKRDHVDLPVLMTRERNCASSATEVSLSINWTPSIDKLLVKLVLQQMQRGHQVDDVFDEQAWAFILESFNKKSGLHCDKCSLKDRYILLKNLYKGIDKLLGHGGFTWDETQKMIIADDNVWEAHIKEHPDTVSYRGAILSSYSDFRKIFHSRESDTGSNTQIVEMVYDERGVKIISDRCVAEGASGRSSLGMAVSGASGSLPLLNEEIYASQKQKKRSTVGSLDSEHSRKVRKTETKSLQPLSEMANIVAELVSKKSKNNNNLISSAIDALQAIPGMDDELLLDACDLLEDEKKAKTLLALDPALRKKWLLRKLRT